MLATCVVNGWPTETYLDVEHPLQAAIASAFGDLGCVVHHVGVDGCGAPTHALALHELAGAYAAIGLGRCARGPVDAREPCDGRRNRTSTTRCGCRRFRV